MTHGTLQLCDSEFLQRSSSVPCCRWICHPCWSLTKAALSGDWNGNVTQCLLDVAGEFIPASKICKVTLDCFQAVHVKCCSMAALDHMQFAAKIGLSFNWL